MHMYVVRSYLCVRAETEVPRGTKSMIMADECATFYHESVK